MAGSQYLEDDAIGGVKDELIALGEGGGVRFDIALTPLANQVW